MSISQATPSISSASASTLSTNHIWRRLLVLCLLILLSLALYVILINVAPPADGPLLIFLPTWSLCFLPYFAACIYIIATKPLPGRWFWIELGLILLAALIFRIMLLPLPPGLSRDVWRYLWDAREIVHGYSPYVYAPGDKILTPLRDILYANARFRNITTDYPPGAELIFIIGYLLDSHSLLGLKTLFLGFDMTTCFALTWLLIRRGLDPRRVLIYAWCPLVTVEFAINGHIDVLTVTFLVLSILCATYTSTRARILTGFFIAMATLTRLYPILLLPVVLRRRDWPLLLTCLATIFLGYLPFIILGHGQVFGFFLTYVSEQGRNAGIIQKNIRSLNAHLGFSRSALIQLEYVIDLLLVATGSLLVLLLRQLERISMEMATLLLTSTALAISSHLFPWYATALLPWIAVLIAPFEVKSFVNLYRKLFRTRRGEEFRETSAPVARKFGELPVHWRSFSRDFLSVTVPNWLKVITTATAWYVACTIFLSYTLNVVGQNTAPAWATFFYVDDGIVVKRVVAGAIVLVYCCATFAKQKNDF